MTDRPQSQSVGYGRPPAEHQFKRGKSGTPKGRPKADRAVSFRQFRRDVLKAGNRKVTMTTPDGRTKRMTMVEAMLLKASAEGLGNRIARRAFLDLYACALKDHERSAPEFYSYLDELERKLATDPEVFSSFGEWLLDQHRQASRRF